MFGSWRRHRQPMMAPCGLISLPDPIARADLSRFAIAAVVKLDNHSALRHALHLSLNDPLTDSQLILHAYERWGRHCCDYLLGAYSFVIWDTRSTALFCARDHIGSVPFYYSLTPEQFIFGTSIDDILAAENVSGDLDERFIRTRLANRLYFDHERTFYHAVRKLPAGHTLTVSPDKAKVTRYWFPEHAPHRRLPNDDAYVSACVELLQTVITEQLPPQGDVAVHLSGGLDSSTITAVAAQQLHQRNRALPLAYCWLPSPVSKPLPLEHDLIEQVRSQLALTLRFQQLTGTDFLRGLIRDLTLLPGAGLLFHEQIVMRQAMNDNVHTILSGWGGDEVIAFNGRGYYAGLLRSRQWRRLWRESRAVSRRPLKHILSQGILPQYPSLQQVYKRVTKGQLRKPSQYYLHPDFMRQVKPYPHKPRSHLNTRQTQLALLNNGHLVERMEAWATLGATHNLIYRYPLLDKRIIEFALGLPPEMFRRGKSNRWLMRNAAARLLPADVAWNPDKSDPIRVNAFRAAKHEALLEIGQQLRTQAMSPSRAVYLDMPRLLADLSPDRLANWKPSFGKILDALLFLDF